MTNYSNKKKILFAVLSTLAVILIAGSILVVTSINDNMNKVNSDDKDIIKPPNILIPTIDVPESIKLDKLETAQFSYIIQNQGDYKLNIFIQDESIATIDNELKITPIKVGTTVIKLQVNCEPVIEKTTILIINDAVTDYSYNLLNIDNTTTDNALYVNNEYILEIKENAVVTEVPNIGYDKEKISNFSFVSKDENVLKYKFIVKQYGEFYFDYSSKYCHKNTSPFFAYVYPSDFEIIFNNIVVNNNTINLFLFNSNFLSLANNSGYYDSCCFSTKTIDNSNDELIINSSNSSCINLNENNIKAINEGSSILSFESKISHFKKEYTIVVKKILPTTFIFNEKEYDIGAQISLSLNVDEPVDFVFNIQPIYSFGNLEIICSNGLDLSQNKLTLLANDNQYIQINLDEKIVANFSIQKQHSFFIQSKVYFCTSEYTFENNTILVNYSQGAEIILQLEVIDESTNQRYIEQELLFEILDESIITSNNSLNIVKNYFATLSILKTGQTTIKIYNSNLKISLTICINVY